MSVIKQRMPERKPNPLLPAMGLLLAVTLLVLSLMVAPTVVKLLAENIPQLSKLDNPGANTKVIEIEDIGYRLGAVDLVVAIMMWLLLFSILMVIAVAAAGPEPDEVIAKARMGQPVKLPKRKRK